MAAVYAASHRNGQRAALKVLHSEFALEKSVCDRFLREAYVSNKVNHSATVQVLDDDATEQGEPFLVMELLQGETVREAWKKLGRTMPAARAVQICERIVDCLASCHAINVIHRDLKPANVFITNDGEIKVLDFGVAQLRDATVERTATGTALGTPAYMSPEQAMGLVDQLDGRADLFSVGAILHALVTGHRINNGRTEQEALVMAATRPVPSVARLAPHLSVELVRCIDRSLAWDRRNRYQNAREMQGALLDLLARDDVAPLSAKPPPRSADAVAPASATASDGSASRPATRGSSSGSSSRSSSGSRHVSSQSTTPESDPRVQGLRDVMRHFDRVLPNVRQLGWSHPATDRSLRTAHDAVTEALRQGPIAWTIRPHSFAAFSHAVWEPGPPADAIPYNLFACGMRLARIEPGLTLDELRELLVVWLLEPGRDLPPEDDLATVFWDRALAHVHYECVDVFAEGDGSAREVFFGEADRIERLAEAASRNAVSHLETRAMAVSTDNAALNEAQAPSPFALDEAQRQQVAPRLTLSREEWTARYVEVLVEGYLDAVARGDAAIVLASLRASTGDRVVTGRLPVAIDFLGAIVERLRLRVPERSTCAALESNLMASMFGGETFSLLLDEVHKEPQLVPRVAPIVISLGRTDLGTALSALPRADAALRRVLTSFVERHVSGSEDEVVEALRACDPETAAVLVTILARSKTPAADRALSALSTDTNPALRIEARAALAPSDQALADLVGHLEDPTPAVRIAALGAMRRHAYRKAWPAVSRLAQAKGFVDLSADERRELLRTTLALSPEHGEPLLVDLVRRGGVLASENREGTRAIAAQVLGEFSDSESVVSLLREVAQARWGASEETRAAALASAERISQRLAEKGKAP